MQSMGASVMSTAFKTMKLMLAGLVSVAMMAPVQAQPNYMAVSNCFWIVAPIHELSREMQLNELWSFTQGRIGWFTGFYQANKGKYCSGC